MTWLKLLNWLKNYWYIPFIAIATCALWVGNRRRKSLDLLKRELKASKEAQKAAENIIVFGAEKAKKIVKMQHKKQIDKLRGDQVLKYKELKNDPQKLARYFVRIGSGK